MDTVSTILMDIRLVDGKVQLLLPDDPRESTGPTKLVLVLTPAQLTAMTAALPDNARTRLETLVASHVQALKAEGTEAQRAVDTMKAQVLDAEAARVAVVQGVAIAQATAKSTPAPSTPATTGKKS